MYVPLCEGKRSGDIGIFCSNSGNLSDEIFTVYYIFLEYYVLKEHLQLQIINNNLIISYLYCSHLLPLTLWQKKTNVLTPCDCRVQAHVTTFTNTIVAIF